jgi:beta-glucosidase
LKNWFSDLQFVAEAGQFGVYIGGSSNTDNKVGF